MAERPNEAYIFSLIAGVLMLLGAFLNFVINLVFRGLIITIMRNMMERMMVSPYWAEIATRLSGFVLFLSLIGLVSGAVVIYASTMLKSKPAQHSTWGAIIIIFSILSVFGAWAGFGIGMLLGIIGGILAIWWRPPVTAAQAQPTGVFCQHCGFQIPVDSKFCPHCGREQTK